MSNMLEQFKISKLYGNKTITVSIKDNTLVLVGENGSGKTTFLRILLNFLSRQWSELMHFPFEEINAIINGNEYQIFYKDLITVYREENRQEFSRRLPSPINRKFMELVHMEDLDNIAYELEKLSNNYGIPEKILSQEFEFFSSQKNKFSDNGQKVKVEKELRVKMDKIHDEMQTKILYLPTYRRIERELSSIFKGIDTDDFRRISSRRKELGDVYIELVEFGMKDVQLAVDRTLETLKETARENLNNLTLKYLGDVVNQEYKNVGIQEIAEVSVEDAKAILDRIDDNILTKEHKKHLFDIISAPSGNVPTEHEQIIYHYFLKLLRFQESLQDKEKQISSFCNLCSEYIQDKKFVYDSTKFNFSIVPINPIKEGDTLDFSDLSSGEKQIVSLFSHLYLSKHQNFFVLIDEPELSISVPWQRRFLTDIRNGEFCKGLIAVTHSPFIYQNELRPYTHSLGEFISF